MSTYFPLTQPALKSGLSVTLTIARNWEMFVRPRGGKEGETVTVYAEGKDGAAVLPQPLSTGRSGRIGGEGEHFGWVETSDLPLDIWGRPKGSSDDWQVIPEGDQAALPDSVVSGSVKNALGWVSVIDPGAVAAVAVKDAEVTLASKVIKSPGGHFTPGMNGQFFHLIHGGPLLVTGVAAWQVHPLVGTFTYVSPTEGKLSVAAESAVAAGEVIIGPDAGPGINAAIGTGRGQLPANLDFIVATELTAGDHKALVGPGRTSRLFSAVKKANVFAAAWKTGIKLESFDIYGNGWGEQPANIATVEGIAPNWAKAGCGIIFAHVKQGVVKDVNTYFCGGDAVTGERNGVAGIWTTQGCEECEVDVPAASYNRNGINEDNYFSSAEHEYAPLNNSYRCLAANFNYIGVGTDSGSLARGTRVWGTTANFNVIYGLENHRSNFVTFRDCHTEFNGLVTNAPGWIVHGDEGSEAEYRGAVVDNVQSAFNGGHAGKVSDHVADFRINLGINSRNQFHGIYIANKCKRGKINLTICRDNGLGGEFDGIHIAHCFDITIRADAFDDQGGPTQSWGIFADAECERIVVEDGGYYAGNIKGPIKLAGKECRVGPVTQSAEEARGDGLRWQAGSREAGLASVALTTKKARYRRRFFRAGEVVSNLYVHVSVAATEEAKVTYADLALMNSAGVILAKTANLKAQMLATGIRGGALEAAYTIPEDGFYILYVLLVGTGIPNLGATTSGATGYSAQVLAGGIPAAGAENAEKETATNLGALAGSGTVLWFGGS